MIGSGVFASAGLMAQGMGPGPLLLAWVVGGVLALAGARAYATVAGLVPRSGGEYRYLAELVHPWLGNLAGWTTLLVGFSAPIAINALAAASFLGTLVPLPSLRGVAAAMIVAMVALHALDLGLSRRTQNVLVALKVTSLVGFVVVGVVAGSHVRPTWTPPHASTGFPVEPFVAGLFYVAYAFSGWNAAIYAAEEFHHPGRDVPRAMVIGCSVVAVLYLLVNWIFVMNLDLSRAGILTESRLVTLAQLVAQNLLGPRGAAIMSALLTVGFLSTMSAMIFAGPRVCAAMARDGFLPAPLEGLPGRPPAVSVALQGLVALALLYAQRLQQTLLSVGALVTLFSALTASSLFWVRLRRRDLPRPPLSSLLSAALYVGSAAWMLYIGMRGSMTPLLWFTGVVVLALLAYSATRSTRRVRDLPRPESRRGIDPIDAPRGP